MHSRYEILNEEYSKTVHIEALTLTDMINRQVLPAVESYAAKVAGGVAAKAAVLPELRLTAERSLLTELAELTDELYSSVKELEKLTVEADSYEGSAAAHFYRNAVIPQMDEVRKYADALELIVDQKDWPYPTYGEMLFYVN